MYVYSNRNGGLHVHVLYSTHRVSVCSNLETIIYIDLFLYYRPLSEGKFLKLKFDDIFAASRYSKALESIRKFRIEQVFNIYL